MKVRKHMSPVKQAEVLNQTLAARWEQSSRKLADLAGAIPADKFESHPVPGIRAAGDVVRHVAFWHRYVAETLRGNKPDDSANELPLSEFPTRTKALDALNRAATDAAQALRKTSLDDQAAELVVSFIEHTSEHYGQLVVYARLMGLVPPASRG